MHVVGPGQGWTGLDTYSQPFSCMKTEYPSPTAGCFLYPSVPREPGQVSGYRYQILCADHCFLTLEKTA